MKSNVRHLSCPSCGGTLAFKEGERISVCPSCGTRSLIEIKDHIPKYVIEPDLDLRAAKSAARRLLAGEKPAPDIKKAAGFYSAGLYYLPFYEMTAQRVGKMTTKDIVRKYDVTMEEYKANVIIRDIQHQAPAVRLGEWGLENIHLDKLRQLKSIKPFDPAKLEKDAHVFDSDLPVEATEIGKPISSIFVANDETKLLRKNIRLVFCPVWLIKYTYHNRLYRLVIDGVTGKVLFGRAPARDSERIPIMIGTLAVLTYPIARAVKLAATGSLPEVGGLLLVLSIPIFLILMFFVYLLAMAWNQFRYSGEVVWRGEHVDIERVNKPPETALERLGRTMSSIWESTMEGIEIERGNRWYGPW